MNTLDWKILFYESPSLDTPVQNFIDGLELKAQSKVYNTLELLTQFGIRLGLPHVKKVTGTDLWELRILGSDSVRIIYVAMTGKTFLLLHGFIKKKQKTPTRELTVATKRFDEYRARKNTA